MKFFVGIAAGAALAAAAYVYAYRNPAAREAFEGVRADVQAGDVDALQARLDTGLAEARRQVEKRFGPQTDWAAEAVDVTAGPTLLTSADDARPVRAAPSDRGANGATGVTAPVGDGGDGASA
jgi:hypothetical protein